MRRWLLFPGLLVVLSTLGAQPAVAAAVDWHAVDPSQVLSQTRVQGDIDTLPVRGGVQLRGWVVDGFSATRPDHVEVRDQAGQLLGAVQSGQFQRRYDVEQRFGSSAYALSGFELSLVDPPRALLVRAHLGQLGWWQTTISAPVQPRASVTRVECVASDAVEVQVSSADAFPVRDALLQLTVGDQTSTLSRYADDGDLHTVIFVLRPDQFAAISATDLAFVSYDPFTPTDFWEVGSIDPSTAVGCDQSSSGG